MRFIDKVSSTVNLMDGVLKVSECRVREKAGIQILEIKGGRGDLDWRPWARG